MKELNSEIEIESSDQVVWQVLTDFASYPLWNPFIRWIKGEAIVASRLEVRLQPSGARGMTFKPTVLKVEPRREFRWLGHLFIRGLFDGEHIFILENLGPNRTRFVQREVFKGVLVPLIMGSIGADTQRGFAEMNQALKARAEQL